MERLASGVTRIVVTAVTSVGVWGVGLLAEPARGNDVCDLSSEWVLRSCQTQARADARLAQAKCLNLSSAAMIHSCRRQATVDLRDQLATCDEGDEARDTVCSRLGEGAYDPVIDPAAFVATVDNPFFPLTPGKTFVYEGQTSEGYNHTEFAVTHNTKVILGVTCVEVRDTVHLDGALAEDTVDWFAQDRAGNVWYFGENTGELTDGRFVTLDGTFTSGVNGAKPGIIMKAHPVVGAFYRQEFDLGNAEDLAEVVSLTESVTVPIQASPFPNCLKTVETTPLEASLLEYKYYAAGVGNVLTLDANNGDRLELIQIKSE